MDDLEALQFRFAAGHNNRGLKTTSAPKWSGPLAYAARKVPHLTSGTSTGSCTQQLDPCGLVLLVGACFFDHYRSNKSSTLEQQPWEKSRVKVVKDWGFKPLFTWFALTPHTNKSILKTNLIQLWIRCLFQSTMKHWSSGASVLNISSSQIPGDGACVQLCEVGPGGDHTWRPKLHWWGAHHGGKHPSYHHFIKNSPWWELN